MNTHNEPERSSTMTINRLLQVCTVGAIMWTIIIQIAIKIMELV